MSDALAAIAAMPIACHPMSWKADVTAYLIVNTIIAAFMTVVVVLRAYARVTGAGLGVDDWLAILSWLVNIPLLAIQGVLGGCGSGHPITEAMLNVPLALRLAFAFQLLVVASACASKLSVLFFYMRVFKVTNLFVASCCAQVLVGAWTLSFLFAIIFSCSPVKGSWDLVAQSTATCINQVRMFLGLIFSNAIIDIIIMALPIHSILQLQMRFTDKMGVLVCILLGVIAVIAAVFRGAYTISVDFTNLTGTMPLSMFLSNLEPFLSVICISLPTLRPLWRRYRGDPSSSAGTMKLTGGASGGHSNMNSLNSRGTRGIQITKDTTIDYTTRDVEMDGMRRSDNHHHFDESSSERNLYTTTTAVKDDWSR